MKPILRLFGLGLLAFVAYGCYSFSGATLPSHLRTVHVLPVENRTLESSLGDQINQKLADGFRKRSNLRIVNEGGDAELRAILTQYSHAPQSTSGDRVSSFRVDLLMQVYFIDRIKGDTLYHDDRIPGYAAYSPERGETEEIARQLAVENLVKVVVDNTVSAW